MTPYNPAAGGLGTLAAKATAVGDEDVAAAGVDVVVGGGGGGVVTTSATTGGALVEVELVVLEDEDEDEDEDDVEELLELLLEVLVVVDFLRVEVFVDFVTVVPFTDAPMTNWFGLYGTQVVITVWKHEQSFV